ncbi:MAG: ferredoxin [Candidatus Parcubacteria bacterium]|nr:ferredoxin [Candidatus Parcubacteria bacterium]
MAKIIQNHEGCIGCGSCAAVCPKFGEMNVEEGKSILKNGKKNEKGEYELEVKDIECNQEAADVCPVSVIKIEQ